MQVSDCHWFSLNESPTNIILFPLSLDKKSLPLNLHEQIKRVVAIKMLGLYIYLWTKEGRQPPLNNKIVSIWRNLLILVRIQLYWTPEEIYYIDTHLPIYLDITCIFCQNVIALHYLPMGQLLELTKKIKFNHCLSHV